MMIDEIVKEDSLWRWSKQARTWAQALSNHVPYFVDTILQWFYRREFKTEKYGHARGINVWIISKKGF